MDTLIQILEKETQSLKNQFIEKTKDWSNKYFYICERRKNWKETDWCDYLGIKPEVKNAGTSIEFLGFPRGFYNTSKSRELIYWQNEIRSLLNMGLNNYIKKEEEKAIKRYKNSVIKLANRIENKHLNIEKLTVLTSHIGVNLEMTLTDGIKTIKAFTIIAEGVIQRPHYRYLIK
ncbi:MAG: hypothetical protein PHF86_00555 [Candidatus Nanoarchaeia archaeon]|nr:hypothetical protein [Candidatus Nanoarchaeia archaeon]